ncbi:MAG: TRAP transporter large permease subunit, partial [Eubacteriales bacterium]|nr:TRAP transporter large permease subunit [Eubacteriales bacterium]
AAYAVAASVVAPGLIRMGIDPLMAHFFVFYFACVSAITPPVALAAYAASGISGSDPMRTSFTSFRLGIAAYIVPFMFFYAPEMLLQGPGLLVISSTVTALIGIYGLAGSMQGWYFGKLPMVFRCILFVAAVSLVHPSMWFDVVGLSVFALLFFIQKARKSGPGKDEAVPASA